MRKAQDGVEGTRLENDRVQREDPDPKRMVRDRKADDRELRDRMAHDREIRDRKVHERGTVRRPVPGVRHEPEPDAAFTPPRSPPAA